MKLSLIFFTIPLVSSNEQVLNAFGQKSYGVDTSFPIHYGSIKSKSSNPLGDRQAIYDEFMEGCREFYGNRGGSCDVTEEDRYAMSLRQPASMQNYTDVGFKKVRAPAEVFSLLSNYWDTNLRRRQQEKWPTGNTYVNYWKAPTYMVNVENTNLRSGGQLLKQKIWDGVKPVLEEWTGMELEQSSMYGIRQYTRGAILSPHADRMPLISSCIINVAQDVEEDWPLEVYGRDGLAYNVTMSPGDMVLYESHSLIHGRPFPLQGEYFANIFIHFRPTGKLLRERKEPVRTEDEDGLPIYILSDSPEEKNWLRSHPKKVRSRESPAAAPLSNLAHAAATGDIETITYYAKIDKAKLHEEDANGWQPIHEAARGGHQKVVELLIKHGADVNKRVNFGEGESILGLVIQNHGRDHPLVDYLYGLGALEVGPDL
mmetsp:Transcript_7494/g.16619  ORF Transcript_7494/g.16619 Transcript_7494/m.16619 type:complete len:428 (-) Transcript_7494:2006-3289(-)